MFKTDVFLELYPLHCVAKHIVTMQAPLAFQASVLDFVFHSVIDQHMEKEGVEIPLSDDFLKT